MDGAATHVGGSPGPQSRPAGENDVQRRHERDVESAVRLFRWAAVIFAVLQIGVLYQPSPGVEVPFPRLPVAGAFAAVLIGLNLVSRWAEDSRDPVRLRRASLIQLAVDTLLAFAVVVIFVFDPEIRLWPLFVLPVLEGALRFQMRGAVGAALASTALGAVATAQWPDITTPEIVSSVAFQLGVLITVAIGAGGLARRLEQAREIAEERARRLHVLAEHAPQMTSHRRLSTAATALLEATRAVVGAPRVELHLKEAGGWRRVDAVGDELGDGDDLVDELLDRSVRGDGDAAPPDGQLIVEPLREEDGIVGALVVRLRDDADAAVDRNLVRMIAAHAAASVGNARVAETEARTIAELRAFDEMKDEFVHILAHELRGPLTHIAQYAHMLRERPDDLSPDRRTEFLLRLEQTTARLSRLVSDVQEVTQADLGDLPVAIGSVDLEPAIREVATQEVEGSPHHRLELDVPAGTPRVAADPDRLRQVLANLLSNAVKYSPDGGRVRVEVRHDDEVATVSVTDDGVGVPSHLQRHLFQKFVRIPSETYARGTGLGLYLTRRLVEAMGGEIRLESVAGRGSTFTFTLPVATASDGADVGDVARPDLDRAHTGPQHESP